MLRSKPRLSFCGLSIILSNQSRFDKTALLTCTGGSLFNNYCLRPELNSMMCDIRLTEDRTPFLPGTKCILLLGEAAMHDWLPETRGNTLNEMRGSVFYWNKIPCIPSFFPQDAADAKAWEQTTNPLSKEYSPESDDYEKEEAEDIDSTKKLGRTKRSNYGFWLRADVRKAKFLIKEGRPPTVERPRYITYPDPQQVINVLRINKNKFFYLDIETDYENLQCFSFTFDGLSVYNIPILDFNYYPAYSCLPAVLASLAIAIRDNIVVAHNGANFDFFVLSSKYKIPFYRVYDTMIAQHRAFPDIEKPLGHCTSLHTWERFHKDQDSKGYQTRDQMMARLAYCGKDVFTMFLVHQAIDKYAKTIPGLSSSIDTAQSHIIPYLTVTLQGMRYNQCKLEIIKRENDRLMGWYLHFISILIGPSGMESVRHSVKGRAKGLPGSNTQCCHYFHELLGYPTVVPRSQKTGKPSLGKKAMFLLALKHNNPVITFTLMYRILAKETGSLKFVPWRGDDNKIINYGNWIQATTQA